MEEKKYIFSVGFIGNLSILPISSDFGNRQLPGEKKPRMHNGIDIAVASGTQIKSPVNGRVVSSKVQAKDGTGAGLFITIEFNIDATLFYISFMHLSQSYVSVGERITEGKLIGLSGGNPSDQPNAGCSRGAHIHLEIRRYRDSAACAVDPKYYFLSNHTLNDRTTGKSLQINPIEDEQFQYSDLRTQTFPANKKIEIGTQWNASEYSNKKKKPKTTTNERLAPGIWQITKLIIDSSVENKQVTNSGISTQTGSLLNFIRNVCQDPMVEFSGDTFGNQYYWMIRRPPFDKEGLKRMMDATMINIQPDDVISTNLNWNADNIYSWYQYVPYGDLLGTKEASLYMPAVFFQQFAQVWGSKPLVVQSNYYNYRQSGRFNSAIKDNQVNGDNIINNAIKDFKYIIESNAYNAFTRQGTITIRGDRRIKRGTLIYLLTTGEIYYVESVSNSLEVGANPSRITTLQVSHGIYPSYIEEKEINQWQNAAETGFSKSATNKSTKVSYFNIIDWGEGFDPQKVDSKNWNEVVSKWKVNETAFNFFMSKQQVLYENMLTDVWYRMSEKDGKRTTDIVKQKTKFE